MLHEALGLQQFASIRSIEVARLRDQVIVERVDVVFDLLTGWLHECRVFKNSWPSSPSVFCAEVLLKEEPQLEGTNGPLRVN